MNSENSDCAVPQALRILATVVVGAISMFIGGCTSDTQAARPVRPESANAVDDARHWILSENLRTAEAQNVSADGASNAAAATTAQSHSASDNEADANPEASLSKRATLESVLRLTVANSPMIKAAAHRWQAATHSAEKVQLLKFQSDWY